MSKRLTFVVLVGLALTAPALVFADSGSIHKEHSFEARPGATVLVDVSFHHVEVEARPGSTVDVVVDIEASGSTSKVKQALDQLEPVFLDKGDTLVIRSVHKKISWTGSPRVRGQVTVAMPPGMNLTIDSSSGGCEVRGDFGDARLAFDLSSGGVDVSGAAREIATDSSSGSTEIDLTRPADRISVDASSGGVNITGGARDLRVDVSSGGVHASGLLGDAVVDSSSGRVDLAWSAVPADANISVDSSSGGVTLQFPSGTTLDGTVDTSSGGISSDFPGQSTDRGRKFELAGGLGAASVRIDTSSGGVRLLAR
jgi:hypothetical protein